MSDSDDVKTRLLEAAKTHVPFDGWSETAFRAAVQEAEVEPGLAKAVCPRGAIDLALAYHEQGDMEMIRRIEETDDTVQFAFTPVPGEESDDMERKILKKVKASATLSKADGQVLSFSMSLPKPFKPAMIAKINTFQLDATCVRAPDGRTYLEAMQMDVSGSAMMQAFSQTVTQRITKLLDPVSIP